MSNNGHRGGLASALLAGLKKAESKPAGGPPKDRVAICVCSDEMVRADFALSLAALCFSPGAGIALVSNRGPNPLVNLNQAVIQAEQLNVTHILFVSGNLTFPMDALRGLLSRDKDIVGATFMRNAPPYDLLGKLLAEDKGALPSTGIVEVAQIPIGLLLVRMAVFQKLARPWFQMPLLRQPAAGELAPEQMPQQLETEEAFFCRSAREAGFSVVLDVDLTKAVGHLGQHSFRVPPPEAPDEEPKQEEQVNQDGVDAHFGRPAANH